MAKDALISAERLACLIRVFGNCCALCGNELGKPFTLTSKSGLTYTVNKTYKDGSKQYSTHLSHIVPESDGGTFGLENMFLSHAYCNRTQQDTPLAFYCDYNDTHLTYEQILECNAAAVSLAQEIRSYVNSVQTAPVIKIAWNLKSEFPNMFQIPKRMSQARYSFLEKHSV